MSPGIAPKLSMFCQLRLAEITEVEMRTLTQFAVTRLVAAGVPVSYGEDAVQRAFQMVLRGLEREQGGRKPRMVDLGNKAAFLKYMLGVVSSVTYRMAGDLFEPHWRGSFKDFTLSQAPGECSPARWAVLSDLSAELFLRMRARAPRHLLPTIDAWEKVFLESDRIPPQGRRHHVREIRALAQHILAELGELGVSVPKPKTAHNGFASVRNNSSIHARTQFTAKHERHERGKSKKKNENRRTGRTSRVSAYRT